jgi:hypothetical protein
MQQAALGFRVHTGWAATIVLAGPASSPQVIDRRRLELVEPCHADHAAVYHRARELSLDEAGRLVRSVTEATRRTARSAVAALVAETAARGYRLGSTGLVQGNGRLPPTLEAILRSHPMVHTAEGELFRQALADASAASGLAVSGVPARDLYVCAAAVLGGSEDGVRDRLAALGKRAGRPWGQDQKESALVAWLALAGHASR